MGLPVFQHLWALGTDGSLYKWASGVFTPKYVRDNTNSNNTTNNTTTTNKVEVASVHIAKDDNTVFVVNSVGEVYVLSGHEREGEEGSE